MLTEIDACFSRKSHQNMHATSKLKFKLCWQLTWKTPGNKLFKELPPEVSLFKDCCNWPATFYIRMLIVRKLWSINRTNDWHMNNWMSNLPRWWTVTYHTQSGIFQEVQRWSTYRQGMASRVVSVMNLNWFTNQTKIQKNRPKI